MNIRETVRLRTSRHVALVPSADTPAVGESDLNLALETLGRLRDGWRPDQQCLASAQRSERWSVTCQSGALAYQFVGVVTQPPAATSWTIATMLAVDPEAGWALVFSDRWIRLGEPSPEMPPFDPMEVAERAERWILSHIRR